MRDLGVKFLGTIKNSLKYPFYFIEINENGKPSIDGRAVIQLYGMRSSWTATSRNPKKNHDVIQASAFRHGQGKVRAARLCTSIPSAMKPNEFVCETASSVMSRIPHESTPAPLSEGATVAAQIHHTFQLFHSEVFRMSTGQTGPGWMCLRLFRMTSTSFHTLVNVQSASYLNTPQLRELHADALSIIQLDPTTDITNDNVADTEDETLPSQRSGLHAVLAPKNEEQNTLIALQSTGRAAVLTGSRWSLNTLSMTLVSS